MSPQEKKLLKRYFSINTSPGKKVKRSPIDAKALKETAERVYKILLEEGRYADDDNQQNGRQLK